MSARYFEPTTVTEAVNLLAEEDDVAVLAGGTDLVVGARGGKRALPASLVAIHRITDLAGVVAAEDGMLRVGALTTHATLTGSPLIGSSYRAISDASALVGSPATRNVGTLGGNLCNASPAMETGSPLLIFDAAVELASAKGTRVLPLTDFVQGSGRTTLASGELLTAVLIPPPPRGPMGSAYVRLEYRRTMEIAVVGAAAFIALDAAGVCIEARLGLTAVAPTCVRVSRAEAALHGKALTDDLLDDAGWLAAEAVEPIDDVRAPARYRRAMVPVIVRRAFERALERARRNAVGGRK